MSSSTASDVNIKIYHNLSKIDFSQPKPKQNNEYQQNPRNIDIKPSIKQHSQSNNIEQRLLQENEQLLARLKVKTKWFIELTHTFTLNHHQQEMESESIHLNKMLKDKQNLIEALHFEIATKDDKIGDLLSEIRKRKQDMLEMSRRIIELDRELKMYSNYCLDYDSEESASRRPASQLSFEDCKSVVTLNNPKWMKLIQFG